MSLYSDTIRSLWPHHQIPSMKWQWGLCAWGECELCDLVSDWLEKQPQHGFDYDWQLDVLQQIRARRVAAVEPVSPQAPVFIDPHAPMGVPKEEEPAMEKIKRGRGKKPNVTEVPIKPQVELSLTAMSVSIADNENEDDVPVPAVVAPPTFKLTHPTEFTLRKGRRKR